MQAVLAAPVGEGRERDEAARPSDDHVGAPRGEERAVPAIVLDDEDAHQQRAGRHGERKREQIGVREDEVHRHTAGEEGTERGEELQCAFPPFGARERGRSLSYLGVGPEGAVVDGHGLSSG